MEPSASPGPGFLRPAEEHMSPISVLLSQHAIKAQSRAPILGPPLVNAALKTTPSAPELLFRFPSEFLEHRDARPDISAPLTLKSAESGRTKPQTRSLPLFARSFQRQTADSELSAAGICKSSVSGWLSIKASWNN